MSKPRVFISSTFYDLRQVRSDLDLFIENLGYDPVRNEEGEIPYGHDEALEEYCYKEIKNVDILVSIIGGRLGSESRKSSSSISQLELKTAQKEEKQVYIFIEKNVLAEYETYLINKGSAIKFRYVDDIKVYQFIEEVKASSINNNIKDFETSNDIIKYLKEQFAGLFQRFLAQQNRLKEMNLITNLEKTSQTLNKLVTFLSEENKGQTEDINKILAINHPLVETLRTLLNIPYNFYIEGIIDLKALLNARLYIQEEYAPWDVGYDLDQEFYIWKKSSKRNSSELMVSRSIFDNEGKLKFYKRSDWKESLVTHKETDNLSFKNAKTEETDLPF